MAHFDYTPHKQGKPNTKTCMRWNLCDCEAGRIGASHCPKCCGLGFTSVVEVKSKAESEHSVPGFREARG